MKKKNQDALNQAQKQIENAKQLAKEAEKRAKKAMKEAEKKVKEARKKAEKTPGEDVYCEQSKKSPYRENYRQIAILNEPGSVNYGKQTVIQETSIKISNEEEIEIDIDLNE